MSDTVYKLYGLGDLVRIIFERNIFSGIRNHVEGVISNVDAKREYLDIKDSETRCLLKISPYAIKRIEMV